MTRIQSQLAMATFALVSLGSLAAFAAELSIPGGTAKLVNNKPAPATFPPKGGVAIPNDVKAILKDKSKPLYAYLEGVVMPDDAVDCLVFLHDGAADGVDFHNYLASVGNVATGHQHGGKKRLVFDVRDFELKDKSGKILEEGQARSHLADDKVKTAAVTLFCKEGSITFEKLVITEKELK